MVIGKLPKNAVKVTPPGLSVELVPAIDRLPAPSMNAPSSGLVKLKAGGLDTAMLKEVDLEDPDASMAVATKMWFPEPTRVASKLNW